MEHVPPRAARRPQRRGAIVRSARYLYRVPLLLLHLLVPLPLTLLCLAPPLGHIRWGPETLGDRAVRAWSAGLMWIFGFRLRRVGTPLPGPVLFVANHVSWIDIEALHSQRMMGFVAKREIAGWPLVGWLAARGQTIFHRRGSADSLNGVLEAMGERLRAGKSVGVFPEGRTRGGEDVGPFHARIFTAAVQAQVPVQPVALRYGAGGAAQTVVAFGPRENFAANFLRLLGEPVRPAEIHFLAPIPPGDVEGRRRIAEQARERIVAAMAR
ncbi:1-acyl-sn-glycerol-3-phosphate acyltransferase [Pseudoxanthomonas broegbernensis]|uniref:1-acyl-sn-glycerol-3-phosphate acyltransferase n=1 Tax=Pseudoxanthomonas broegbernensis TaxID=83619 RepID=A0A7V8GN90_9GAMM|nr:lysophospholipid acyltransferase family protein [Pseudoxanthomonas broegbernensis]KAF1686963.1 1-acyl-sn-glycerol-3-phosphate acyltransferase [Pseudoxanthomonas broegbernensis]MBB6065429.1 1-acyl-sn-glycerol-3-phosphate acyltransferase [Pseudoxanthomonas broegbernensis]